MMITAEIPASLEDAVVVIVASLAPDEIAYMKTPESTPGREHMFAGMSLRNRWGLWQDSVLAVHFKKRFGLGCADDMSAMILKAVWASVRGEHYDPDADARHYLDFWSRQGLDPLTQEKIKAPPARKPFRFPFFRRPARDPYRGSILERHGDFWATLTRAPPAVR